MLICQNVMEQSNPELSSIGEKGRLFILMDKPYFKIS
jgi:hypothetical protein